MIQDALSRLLDGEDLSRAESRDVMGSIMSGEASPAQIDQTVSRAMETFSVPGLAVGIVKDGKLVFAKGYGVRELGKPDPVDAGTRFAIGSTTKAMTVAALGMLVDEGKLKWDDPVTKYVPDFRLSDPYVTQQLTVRDLLTHRTGLGNADLLREGALR